MPEWMKQLMLSGAYFAPENEGGAGGGEGGNDDEGEGKETGAGEGGEGGEGGEKDPEKARLLKDLMKHKTAAKELKDKLEAASKAGDERDTELKSIKEQIADLLGDEGLEGLKKIREDKQKAEEEKQKAEGKYDELLNAQKERHNKAIGDLRKELSDKLKETEKARDEALALVRRLSISNAFASSPYAKESLTLPAEGLERLYGDRFKVETVDGKPVPVAYAGDEKMADEDGNPLSFETALQQIVEADNIGKALIRPKGKGGAGSNPQNGGGDGNPGNPAPKVRGVSRIEVALK